MLGPSDTFESQISDFVLNCTRAGAIAGDCGEAAGAASAAS